MDRDNAEIRTADANTVDGPMHNGFNNVVEGRADVRSAMNGAPGTPLPHTEDWQHITHLKGSDLKISDGEPDVRGWTVTSRDGRNIGKVTDLLVDKRHMLAEYIEVEQAHAKDRRMILPIRTAVLDASRKEVQFLGMSAEALALTPHDPYNSAQELQRELQRFYGSNRT